MSFSSFSSSSRAQTGGRGSQRVEDVYEAQNDQRLDELHSKIRTLRGVTSDIHADVESQNLILDESSNHFSSLSQSLTQTSNRALQAFGISPSSSIVKPLRIAMLIVCLFLAFWLGTKILAWWWSPGVGAGSPGSIPAKA